MSVADLVEFACLELGCGRGFGSAHALRIHTARAHSLSVVEDDAECEVEPEDVVESIAFGPDEYAVVTAAAFLAGVSPTEWLLGPIDNAIAAAREDARVQRALALRSEYR
jgi:hypothetical protein